MSSPLATWGPLVMTRWRQARRKFDARLLNERRLIICAALALIGFMLDSALITPSFKTFSMAGKRSKSALVARDALQDTLKRRQQDMALQEAEARREIQQITERLEKGKKALADQQSMLAPAREMHTLLESILAQNGGLQIKTMRSLTPEPVKLNAVSGVAISEALLYRHGMEIAVEGSFIEGLVWLRSVENMPRKLLWDSLEMRSDEGRVTLTLKVHTFSPDRDALEIVP
ncbi:MAG: hypothetical protein QM742_13015 [Aquabacterium sp.]